MRWLYRVLFAPDSPPGATPAAPATTATPGSTPAAPAPGTPPAAAPTTQPAPTQKPAEPAKPSVDPEVMLKLQALDRDKWQAEQRLKQALAEADQLRKQADAWRRDPYAAAEAAGVTLEGFTERAARGGRPGPDQQVLSLQQQVESLTETIQQLQQGFQGQSRAATMRSYSDEARRTITTNPDCADAALALEIADVVGGGTPVDLSEQIAAYIEQERQATGRDLTASQATVMLNRELAASLARMRDNPRAKALFAKVFGFEASPAATPPPGGGPAQTPGTTLTGRDESGSEPVDLDKVPRDSPQWWALAAKQAGLNKPKT